MYGLHHERSSVVSLDPERSLTGFLDTEIRFVSMSFVLKILILSIWG